MQTVFIIHGAYGNPNGNWIPWLRSELEDQECTIITPKFPTPENQSLDAWMDVFEEYIPQLCSKSILVGHSLAVSFLLHVLENISQPVRASIFVAGFIKLLGIPEFDEINTTFVQNSFDWDQIRSNCGDCTVFHGDDDPYVPLAFGTEIAEHLGANLKVIPGGGHLGEGAGYSEFPALLSVIKEVLE